MLERVIPGIGYGEGVFGGSTSAAKGKCVYMAGFEDDGRPRYEFATASTPSGGWGYSIGLIYREPINNEVSTSADDTITSGQPCVVYFDGDYLTDQFDTTNITSASWNLGAPIAVGPDASSNLAPVVSGAVNIVGEIAGYYVNANTGGTDMVHVRMLPVGRH